MNMQAMLAQAQKMQRELQKAQDELKEKEFTVEKAGAVKIVMLGDKTIAELTIADDAFDKDNKVMIEEMIGLAINEAMEKVDKAMEEINQRITGRAQGLGI